MIAILERDFITFAKTKKFFVLRSLIFLLPLVVAGFIGSQTTPRADVIGQIIYWTTSVIQAVFFFFVTPGIFAPTLAEERRLKKLDVLRTTPLTMFGIVFSKWLARFGLMASIWFAGLPMSAAALIFGGVTPKHFFDGAMIQLGTILWTGALAFAASGANRDVGRAVRTAYAVVIGWAMLQIAIGALGISHVAMRSMGGAQPGLAGRALFTLIMMSPVGVWTAAGRTTLPNFGLGALLVKPALIPPVYLLFSALIGVICILLALRSMRRDGDESYKPSKKAKDGADAPDAAKSPSHPAELSPEASVAALAAGFGAVSRALWTKPLSWLESKYVEKPAPLWRRIVVWTILIALEGTWVWGYFEARSLSGIRYSTREFALLHIAAMASLFFIMLIRVIASAASIVHRDGEARTEEVLYSTPITGKDLFRAKMIGVFRPIRGLFWLLIAHYVFASVFDSITYSVGGALTVGFIAMFLAFFAAVTMRLAFRAKTLRRALVRAFGFAIVFLIIAPGFMMMMLAVSSPRSSAPFFLFGGYHPGFLTFLPMLFIGERTLSLANEDGFGFAVMYVIFYVVFLVQAYVSSLPRLFAARREDREPDADRIVPFPTPAAGYVFLSWASCLIMESIHAL